MKNKIKISLVRDYSTLDLTKINLSKTKYKNLDLSKLDLSYLVKKRRKNKKKRRIKKIAVIDILDWYTSIQYLDKEWVFLCTNYYNL